MIYRRRATPLHATRAGAGCAYCAALALAALLLSAPLPLAVVAASTASAGFAARVGAQVRRAALLALPLAVAIVVINALVTRNGLTVIWRLGQLPVLGQTDITLQATVYGAVLALRALALILCGTLYTAAVDPDEVLRLFGRMSFRSALTATVATRMVPILARDARRLADAQRCRPGPAPSKVALLRVASTGVLDRALDIAAALEVRGYGAARRRSPRRRAPWSAHDWAFSLAAAAIAGLAIAARTAGMAPFQAYPALHAPLSGAELALSAALLACALAPFTLRRGIER